MFTLTILYIIYYIATLTQLFWFLSVHKLSKTLTQLSFSNAWQSISNYVSKNWMFKLLIIQLSGLPPVFSFFIKVNLLALSLTYTTIFLQCLIFINILLSMFFYLQIFNTTNQVPNKLTLKNFLSDSSLSIEKNKQNSFAKYNYYLCYSIYTFFTFFSFIFFLDMYICICSSSM